MAYGHRQSDVKRRVIFYREDGQPLSTHLVENVYDDTVEKRLERLDLSNLPLECGYSYNWIEKVRSLHFLTVLNLKECGLTQLPPEIATMKRLRRLRVEQNHLTWLPEPLEELTELRILSAFSNQLQTLPSGMYKLLNLRILRLGGNKLMTRHLLMLSNYDSDFRMLSESLQELHLKDNPLLVVNEISSKFLEALGQAELDTENCPQYSVSQAKTVRILDQ